MNELERTQPHDLAAERAVLGGMLLSKTAITDAYVHLRSGAEFYKPLHGVIFDAIRELDDRGEPTDVITVTAHLISTGVVKSATDGVIVSDLVNANTVPAVASVGWYAERVAGLAAKRRVIEAGIRIAEYGFHPEISPADAIERAQADLHRATVHSDSGDVVAFGDIVEEILEGIEENAKRGDGLLGLRSGLTDVDALTGGYRPGQLIVIAGRPGMGKSVCLVDTCRVTAFRDKKPTLLFSLEMSRKELGERIASAETGIDLHDIQRGRLTDRQFDQVASVLGRLAQAPLWLDESPSLTLGHIRSKSRRLQQKHGLQLVAVDYLQLLTTGRNDGNRQQEVADMSRGLKLLAKELECPVVAAAQLNRGPEQRPNKVPALSDLRESGAIEQDSDVVIFIHREDYYDKKSPRVGEADFVVAKNRHGAQDTVIAAAQFHRSRFVDFTPEPAPGTAASFGRTA